MKASKILPNSFFSGWCTRLLVAFLVIASYAPAQAQCPGLSPVTLTTVGNVSFCANDSVIFRAPKATGYTYQWKNGNTIIPGETKDSLVVKTAGSFKVIVTNATACFDSSSAITTTVKSLPGANISPSGAITICQGQGRMLAVRLVGNDPDYTFKWMNGNTVVSTAASYYTATASGSYTLTLTLLATGCSNTSSTPAVITVAPLPAAVVTPAGPLNICEGDTATLDAGSVQGNTYDWKRINTLVGVNSVYKATVAGNYKVHVKDVNGCRDSSAFVVVNTHAAPVVAIAQNDTLFCEGGSIVLSAETTDTSLTYTWMHDQALVANATDTFYSVNATGSYSVIVSRSNVANCVDTSNEVAITVHALPQPSISYDGNKLHTDDTFATYQWYLNGQEISGAVDSTWTPVADGDYTVVVTNANNCGDTSVIQKVVLPDLGVANYYSKAAIAIYPNPATGIVNIATPAPANIKITNMQGQEVFAAQQTQKVDISMLAKGLYIIHITDGNGMIIRTEKLAKQ